MKKETLGLILLIIGTIGGVIAYSTGLMTHDPAYYKMGLGSNLVQIIGLVTIFL